MRWEDERYVRVYVRDTAEWLALGWKAQALLLLLLRKADRAGIIQTGKAGVRGVAALAGMPLEVVQEALPILLDDGCLRAMDGGGYVFPNFLQAQEARSSDAQRKREQRARDREKALASGSKGSVTGLDAEAALSRASGQSSGHASHHGVTRAPDNVTDVTDSVTPSRTVPSRAEPSLSASQASAAASPPPGDELPDATADAEEVSERPPLVLEAQEGPQQAAGATKAPTRPPQPGLVLYERLEAIRKDECERAGVPFVPSRWAFSRQNKDLGPIARLPDGHEEKARFQAAWEAFLDDPQSPGLDEPYSLSFFWKMRSRYEGRGLRVVS